MSKDIFNKTSKWVLSQIKSRPSTITNEEINRGWDALVKSTKLKEQKRKRKYLLISLGSVAAALLIFLLIPTIHRQTDVEPFDWFSQEWNYDFDGIQVIAQDTIFLRGYEYSVQEDEVGNLYLSDMNQRVLLCSTHKPVDIITSNRSQMKIKLTDESVLQLNHSSRIRIPHEFCKENRGINFTGEAFFEIEKDSMHPFQVQMNEACVSVLGTTFNITENDENKEITLLSGKVEVKTDKNTIQIEPGQCLKIRDKAFALENVDTWQCKVWKDLFIALEDVNDIKDLFIYLEGFYNISFHNKNAIPYMRLKGKLDLKEGKEQVLTTLSFFFNIKIETQNFKDYYISNHEI